MTLNLPIKPTDDLRAYRKVLGRFSTGVAIVTCKTSGHQPFGLTVNSFVSISLDPPLIGWCLDNRSRLLDAFCSSTSFGVHILNDQQADLCIRFSTKEGDKCLYDADIVYSDIGTPLLPCCGTIFECQTKNTIELGDHTLIVGETRHCCADDSVPLTYSCGRFALVDLATNPSV